MPRRTLLTCCLLLTARAGLGADPVGLEALEPGSLPRLRSGTAHLASSVDPTGGNQDRGHYRRQEGRLLILAEGRGPGQITRIWSANPQGRLKIWFDNDAEPRIDIPFDQLATVTETTPFVAGHVSSAGGGVSCWFPMPYRTSFRVAAEGAEQLYYQVGYTSFAAGTPVDTFAPGPPPQAPPYDLGGETATTSTVSPGASATLFDLTGPRTLRRLVLSLSRPGVGGPPSFDEMRSLRLRLTWDAAAGPSVDVPLLDFLASGLGAGQYLSSVMAVADWSFATCDFPMPFRGRARGELANRGTTPLRVEASVYSTGGARPDDGYFHAAYRQAETVAGKPFVIGRVNGRGQWVGTSVSLMHKGTLNHLEGDETITVDGAERLLGTGTEDYFDGAWFFRGGAFADPFCGAPMMLATRQMLTAYRWHIGDCIPFRKSINVELEHGAHNDAAGAMYRAVGYWYAARPQTVAAPPVPARLPLFVEQRDQGIVIEAEGRARLASTPTELLPTIGDKDLPLCASVGKLVRYAPALADDALEIPLKIDQTGLYDVDVCLLSGGLESIASYRIGDGPVSVAGGDGLATGQMLRLGRQRLEAGEQALSIWLAEGASSLDVDYVKLTAVGKVDDAVEIEELPCRAIGRGSEVSPQTQADMPADARREGNVTGGGVPTEAVWSGGAQMRFVPAAEGHACEIRLELAIEDEGEYGLAFGITRGSGYGAARVELDGRPIHRFDASLPSGGEVVGWRVPLGTHHLSTGTHLLRVVAEATAGKVRPIGLDYLLQRRMPNGQEAELTVQASGAPGTIKERFGAEPRWSGGAYLRLTDDAELTIFAPASGRYRFGVREVGIPTGGKVAVSLAGRPIGELDCAAAGETLGQGFEVEARLRRGPNTIRFDTTGGDCALDAFVVEPLGGGPPVGAIGAGAAVVLLVLLARRRRRR